MIQADHAATVSGDGLGTSEVEQDGHPRVTLGFGDPDLPDDQVRLDSPRAGDRVTITECGGQTDPPTIQTTATVIGELDGEQTTLRTIEVESPVDGCP